MGRAGGVGPAGPGRYRLPGLPLLAHSQGLGLSWAPGLRSHQHHTHPSLTPSTSHYHHHEYREHPHRHQSHSQTGPAGARGAATWPPPQSPKAPSSRVPGPLPSAPRPSPEPPGPLPRAPPLPSARGPPSSAPCPSGDPRIPKDRGGGLGLARRGRPDPDALARAATSSAAWSPGGRGLRDPVPEWRHASAGCRRAQEATREQEARELAQAGSALGPARPLSCPWLVDAAPGAAPATLKSVSGHRLPNLLSVHLYLLNF
nr:uncharacterized protein LOC127488844 [Oryctolagus cuniculus]XP_051695437.1 uncharacterized protein LOC127488844 [Oryctolagus cuniculus]